MVVAHNRLLILHNILPGKGDRRNSTMANIGTKCVQAGYTPGIYTFKNMWDTKLTDPSLKNRGWSLWLAHWQTGLDYSRSGYDLWQFGTANIAGRGFDGNIGYLDPMTRGTADINEDGESDLRDVLLISTMLAGRMDTTNRQRRAADVDKNGTLNTADVQALAEMLIED